MTDCSNAEMRDLLPDLLHHQLGADARSRIEAHIATCADCAAELALLRTVHASTRAAHLVDRTVIAGAIAPYRLSGGRSWTGWRVAAAITLLAGGGASLLMLRDEPSYAPDSVQVANNLPGSPAVISGATTPVTELPAPATRAEPVTPGASLASPASSPPEAVRELAMDGVSMGDLSDRELSALLKVIDELDAVPSTDVESGSLTPTSPRRAAP
jgi:hypothetical protein